MVTKVGSKFWQRNHYQAFTSCLDLPLLVKHGYYAKWNWDCAQENHIKKLPEGKYLALKTLENTISLLVINLQPSFLSMVGLKAWRCLKLILPNYFFIINFLDSTSAFLFLIDYYLPTKKNSSIFLNHPVK